MSNSKICKMCKEEKDATKDFYMCKGVFRTECKKCSIKRNVAYQKKNKTWKIYFTGEERRNYMREYYAKNKEKCIEYRARFKERNPEYFNEWFRKNKDKKNAKK